jgi:hypothetical protein
MLTPLSRKTPVKQRKPLARVRAKARRNEGRIGHERLKERRVEPNADELRYWESLPDICVACGKPGTVPHHILAPAPGKRGRRDHMLVVRLDPHCHNIGTYSVHLLGSEAAFLRETGVDLVAIAVRNRDEWEARNG